MKKLSLCLCASVFNNKSMEKAVYYFNPENDMALANFTPHYKAPAEIVRMADELAALPAWYAPEGSVVKVRREADIPCWEHLCSGVMPFPQVGWTVDWISSAYVPWGWSPALVYTLSQTGVGSGFLPSDAVLAEWRRLSGRVAASEVLRSFAGGQGLCGESQVCHSLAEVCEAWSRWGNCVLKAPWSGSGRGLVFLSCGAWSASAEGWVARILRTQGALMAEPIYNKVCDFAMEFCADEEGRVAFAGYSFFETDAFGNYKANLLVSDAEIERRLGAYVPLGTLHGVRSRLLTVLPDWLGGHYAGYLGVDMMICHEGDYRVFGRICNVLPLGGGHCSVDIAGLRHAGGPILGSPLHRHGQAGRDLPVVPHAEEVFRRDAERLRIPGSLVLPSSADNPSHGGRSGLPGDFLFLPVEYPDDADGRPGVFCGGDLLGKQRQPGTDRGRGGFLARTFARGQAGEERYLFYRDRRAALQRHLSAHRPGFECRSADCKHIFDERYGGIAAGIRKQVRACFPAGIAALQADGLPGGDRPGVGGIKRGAAGNPQALCR